MSNYARFEPNENTINDYFNNAIGGKIDVTGEPVPVNVHMASKAKASPLPQPHGKRQQTRKKRRRVRYKRKRPAGGKVSHNKSTPKRKRVVKKQRRGRAKKLEKKIKDFAFQ